MKTPSAFDIYSSIRKPAVLPARPHKATRGKGTYSRKGKWGTLSLQRHFFGD